jgi:tRNA dimethylallyltransferase
VGKTALSLELARQFPLEIVSADSRLFYRGMDIGTAKPSLAERTAVPHHLIDICSPAETITLGAYQRLAYAAIHDIQARGRLPLLVGGSGQYVRAVVEGWGIPELPPQPALRAALERLDGDELARWLAGLDPEAAQRIDRRNVRRVIRALEVTLVKGRPISELQRKRPPGYPILQIGLDCDRDALYGRIDQRVDGMMAAGLLAEVAHLVSLGYGRDCPPLSGLGYRQLLDYLAGESSLTEAVERIKFETHRFVRQQYTWFRRDDPALHWFANDDITGVTDLIRRWLAPMVTQ